MNNLWKGIAIASIMAANVVVAVNVGLPVMATMLFSIPMVAIICD